MWLLRAVIIFQRATESSRDGKIFPIAKDFVNEDSNFFVITTFARVEKDKSGHLVKHFHGTDVYNVMSGMWHICM